MENEGRRVIALTVNKDVDQLLDKLRNEAKVLG